jgi:aspartyl-tRNA(Asn)/glutamyl-tRNA(Gln) amidotransferase subunit A
MEAALRSIAELSRLIGAGEISPVELTRQALERIERLDPQLNAYITTTADLALS